MKLLMIADDFTGALDAGVQFAQKGFTTRVLVYTGEEIKETEQMDVLVVDAETRHKMPEEAYQIVYSIVKPAVEQRVPYLFKKTDSALRGNIGAELTAMLDAAKAMLLHFLPAFPRMNRITAGGIHYIDGVPVEESVFGADPFEPVETSNVQELIHQQCSTCVRMVHKGESFCIGTEKTIAVYDCASDAELEAIVKSLKTEKGFRLIAGCAGLAERVPELLGWGQTLCELPKLPEKFMVICGSVNPITVKQLDYGENHGFVRIRLLPQQKLEPDYFGSTEGKQWLNKMWEICSRNNRVILDTNDDKEHNGTERYAERMGISREEMRARIPKALGTIVASLVKRGLDSSMLMTGGDTLLGCIHCMDNARLTPVCEYETGIVLSELVSAGNKTHVFTKSGGFGEETLLADMAEKICRKESQYVGGEDEICDDRAGCA